MTSAASGWAEERGLGVAVFHLLENDLGQDGAGTYPMELGMAGAQCQRAHGAVLQCKNARQAVPLFASSTTGSDTSNTASFTADQNDVDNARLLSHMYFRGNSAGLPDSTDVTLIDRRNLADHNVGAGYRSCGSAGPCSSEWTWS